MMWNILIYVNWFLLTFSGCWRIAFWVAQSFIYLFVFCRSCSKLFSVPWCSFNPKMGSCSMALYLLPSCSSFFFYSAIYWISNVHATCLLAVPVSIVFRFLFRTCVPDNIFSLNLVLGSYDIPSVPFHIQFLSGLSIYPHDVHILWLVLIGYGR